MPPLTIRKTSSNIPLHALAEAQTRNQRNLDAQHAATLAHHANRAAGATGNYAPHLMSLANRPLLADRGFTPAPHLQDLVRDGLVHAEHGPADAHGFAACTYSLTPAGQEIANSFHQILNG